MTTHNDTRAESQKPQETLTSLLELVEAMPKHDRGFFWQRCDWRGNESLHAFNENAKVLKYILDNTEQVATALRCILDVTGEEFSVLTVQQAPAPEPAAWAMILEGKIIATTFKQEEAEAMYSANANCEVVPLVLAPTSSKAEDAR